MNQAFDHRALLAGLTDDQRKSLQEKSDVAGVKHLSLHLALIVLGGTLIWAAVPFYPLIMVAQGVLLVFLFTLLHETTHKTPFKSDWLNSFAGHLAGFVVMLPLGWFRYFHLAHHRHTHDPEHDPELSEPKPTTFLGHAFYMTGLPEFVSRIKGLVLRAFVISEDSFVPERGRAKVLKEARLYLLGYAVLIGGSVWMSSGLLLWVWICPFLLGNPFLRGYLLAEHSRCPHVSDMLENTRTTFTNSVVRFLAWNMPYHAEHHIHPNVPFHKLPEFHQVTVDHLKSTENGYGRFNQSYVNALVDGSLAKEKT